ncbi:MAG: M48 family metallopeptidase [Puniceicoccales bacterium]|jgi:predicted metal-dependent hydrolase|nr:M48 family metallopeptidase [Puniceicoccales bacterium]
MDVKWNQCLIVLEIPGCARGVSVFVPVFWQISPIAIRTSIRLRLSKTGAALLTLSAQTNVEEALTFLQRQTGWFRKNMAKAFFTVTAGSGVTTLAMHFQKYPWVSAAGQRYALECKGTQEKRPVFSLRNVGAPVVFYYRLGHEEEDLYVLVRSFAAAVLPLRVRELAQRVGTTFSSVSVRDQRKRWGSCSGHGTISLNWRLVLLPPEAQDHVILHELAHLWEMNHSERFWNLLASWDPNFGTKNRGISVEWNWLFNIANS